MIVIEFALFSKIRNPLVQCDVDNHMKGVEREVLTKNFISKVENISKKCEILELFSVFGSIFVVLGYIFSKNHQNIHQKFTKKPNA